ncbi:MAG: tryptophan synthase subunit alpha [Nitrospirota bacterium]
MSNRIDLKFKELLAKGQKALITFITAGDPNLELTYELVLEMERSGADIIELGVPFSDPLADGPVIQAASERALKNGTTLTKVLDLVKTLRNTTQVPIALLSYYNPIYKYGVAQFVKDAGDVGVDGVIIPDLPPEEAGELKHESESKNMATIFLLAPTSTPARIRLISHASTGFIYYVSLTGITGMRAGLEGTLEDSLRQIRLITNKPIAVGFGISTKEQVHKVTSIADAAIVGSAIVNLIGKHGKDPQLVEIIGDFVATLSSGRNVPY